MSEYIYCSNCHAFEAEPGKSVCLVCYFEEENRAYRIARYKTCEGDYDPPDDYYE